MRKISAVWICLLLLGVVAAAQRGEGAADPVGTWQGTWQGEGSSGGFELTLEKGKDGALAGRVVVSGEPAYKATLRTVSIEGSKLTGAYDFPPAPEAEVVLTATIDGNSCKGDWVVREKASGNAAAQGTWTVTRNASNGLDFDIKMAGGSLGPGGQGFLNIVYTDSTPVSYSFDTFALRPASALRSRRRR